MLALISQSNDSRLIDGIGGQPFSGDGRGDKSYYAWVDGDSCVRVDGRGAGMGECLHASRYGDGDWSPVSRFPGGDDPLPSVGYEAALCLL